MRANVPAKPPRESPGGSHTEIANTDDAEMVARNDTSRGTVIL